MSRWGINKHREEAISCAPQKTETFLTRHVRLITFLVCITVFLFLFWPIAMPEMRKLSHEGDLRSQMTVSDVLRIADLGTRLQASELDQYVGTKVEMDYGDYYYIDVEPHYQMLAVFHKDTGLLLFCHLSDKVTDEKIDLLKNDAEDFLKQK